MFQHAIGNVAVALKCALSLNSCDRPFLNCSVALLEDGVYGQTELAVFHVAQELKQELPELMKLKVVL